MTQASPRPAGFTVWVTGLPASGKRDLAGAVSGAIAARGQPVEVIDSGRLRQTPLGATLGFSRADRDTNVRRHAMAAAMLTRNGVCAVVSAVSPHQAARDAVREALGPFVLVYAATSPEDCARRDRTGNWARAKSGELHGFTGVDAPYEAPQNADVTVDLGAEPLEAGVARVLAVLDDRGWLLRAPSPKDADAAELAARLKALGYSGEGR